MSELKEFNRDSSEMKQTNTTAVDSTSSPPMVEVTPFILNESIKRNVYSIVEVILEDFEFFGFESKDMDLTKTLKHWEEMAIELDGNYIKLAKYKLAAYRAFHLNSKTLPPNPFKKIKDLPNILIGGRAYRWQHSFMQNENKKFEFLATLNHAKMAMPRPDTKFVNQAKTETFQKLTTERIMPNAELLIDDWNDAEDYHEKVELTASRITVEMQLRRTVREIFKNTDKKTNKLYEYIPFTYADRIKPFFPSTSANYINNRINAGAVGSILDDPDLLKGLRTPGGHLKITRTISQEEERKENFDREFVVIEEKEFEDKFEHLWLRLLMKALKEDNSVKLVGLAEGNKARVITTHQPFRQTVLRSIWKFMHTRMRSLKTFKLIGTIITEEEILNALGNNLEEHEVFLSGDYADATNEIYSFVSEVIADEAAIVLKWKEEEKRLVIEALTEHRIQNPDNKKEFKDQKNSQLMGSIMSFVFLCIANAAGSRWSAELSENKPLKLDQLRGTINGDDVAIKSNKSIYNFWKKITKHFGLNESIGKTFVSKGFVEMNSATFQFNPETEHDIEIINKKGESSLRKCSYTQTKYINQGLIRGAKRSEALTSLGDQDDPLENIAARANYLLDICPTELKIKVYQEFINYNRELLEKTRVPWFLPMWLGGLELPITEEHKPSDKDLRLAHLVVINWKKAHPIQMSTKLPWKTRLLAESRLPIPGTSPEKNLDTERYESIVGKECINLLFDSNYSLDDLYQLIEEDSKVGSAFKKNAKYYDPKGKQLPSPLTIDQLKTKRTYNTYNLNPKLIEDEPKFQIKQLKAENTRLQSYLEHMEYGRSIIPDYGGINSKDLPTLD
jgi:hypothetical protein